MKRSSAGLALALALVAGSTEAARAQGATMPWTLSLPRGATGETTIGVENRCLNDHRFSVDVRDVPWIELDASERLVVSGGTTTTLPATVDTGDRGVGVEDGVLVVRCETCASDPGCSQRTDRVPSRLRILWRAEDLGDELERETLPGELVAVLTTGPRRELRQHLRRWRAQLGLQERDRHDLTLRPLTVIRLDLPSGGDLGALIATLQNDAVLLWVQPNYVYTTAGAPEAQADPYARRQWGPAHIGVPLGQTRASGAGVRVALLDSGVDRRHPDLVGRVETSVDFVDDRRKPPAEVHGTAVAGVIAANAGNGVGIEGVAPGATILAARVCAQTSETTGAATGDTVAVARGLDWAASQSAQIINVSLAGPRDPLVRTLLDQLNIQGVAVIAAAGNRDSRTLDDDEDLPRYPAAYSTVLAVSSVGVNGAPYEGARHGDWVEILAPGQDILTTVPGASFRPLSGSSFAAPHASGALALLLGAQERSSSVDALDQLRALATAVAGSSSPRLRVTTDVAPGATPPNGDND